MFAVSVKTIKIEQVEKHFLRYLIDLPYLHLDKKGHAFIGLGLHISDSNEFCKLRLQDKRTKNIASRDDKTSEFSRIKRLPTGYAVNFYEPFGELCLSHKESVKLLKKKLVTLISDVKEQYKKPKLSQMPVTIQLALVDMAYDLVDETIEQAFPKFNKAIKEKNWPLAAQYSYREGISQARNKAVAQLFENVGDDISGKIAKTWLNKVFKWAP